MAAISLLASTPGNAEASQIIGTINTVITAINTSTLAQAAGTGALNLAIFLPANSSATNLLSIGAATSGSPVVLTVGGSSAAGAQDLEIVGLSTGRVLLGGTSTSAALIVNSATASTADQLVLTGGSSGSNLVSLVAQGSDTNINVSLGGLGATGGVLLGGANSLLAPLQIVQATASTADFIKITGGTSGANLVTLATAGSDTNIDLAIAAAGSGLLRFNNVNMFTATSNVALSLTALGPAALISSTISKWLTVKDSAGGLFYIPCFH